MFVRPFCLFFAIFSVISLFAAQLPEGVSVSKDGKLLLAGGSKNMIIFAPRWRAVSHRYFKNIKNNITRGGGSFSASFDQNMLKGVYYLNVTPVDDATFDIEEKIVFDKPAETPQLSSGWDFPVKDLKVDVDGKSVKFKSSVTKKDSHLILRKKFKHCTIQSIGNQVLHITPLIENSTVQVQDSRVFSPHNTNASLHVFFSPVSGKAVKEAVCKVRCKFVSNKTLQIDISKYADCNMVDDPASGKPGWTRQGAGQDFSSFNAKTISAFGVDFTIPDRKVIAVGGEQRKIRKSCTVDLPASENMQALHVLHNCAWPPAGELGTITVAFSDGTTQDIKVSGVRDCGNWIGPTAKKNGALAWSELNELGRRLGVYLSTYQLTKRNPVKLTLP